MTGELNEDLVALADCRRQAQQCAARVRTILTTVISAAEPGLGVEEVETLLARSITDLELAASEIARLARNQAVQNPGQAVGLARDYVSRQADRLRSAMVRRLQPHLNVRLGFGNDED